jgi:hypothetical protein
MRVRNKEIRSRRQRKEQKIKEAAKALREQFANKPAAKKTAAKK